MKKILLTFVLGLGYTLSLSAQEKIKEKEEAKEREEQQESVDLNAEHAKSKWYKLMHEPNANYFKIKKEYDKYFKDFDEESAPREYGLSWLKTNIFYLDNKGRVQKKPTFYTQSYKTTNTSAFPALTDTILGTWKMIGPRNIFHVGAGLGNGGGYAYITRIDPSNTKKLFTGFVTGGLWISENDGQSWHLADANLPASTYLDIDVCKAKTTTIYAISANGVIKSTDGGLTFAATKFTNQTYTGTAYDLAVSPSDPNLVLVRWSDKVYKTTDGGNTWTIVKSGLNNFSVYDSDNNGEVIDWDVNSNTVFLTDRSNSSTSVTLYKSTDDGATFTSLSTLTISGVSVGNVTGWSKICTATNNTSSVYVFVGSGADSYGHKAAHLFKINKATGVIQLQRMSMVDGVNSNYGSLTFLHHGDITMDINDENKILYGGYSGSYVMYSTDNGKTFTQCDGVLHADIRSVSMVNGKMFVGTDGAGHLSTDVGKTFSLATNTVSNHELWGFGTASKSDILAAGCNHGPLMAKYKNEWFTILGADQGNTDVNPLDSTTIYSQGYDTYHVKVKKARQYSNQTQQIDLGGIYSYFNTITFHPYKHNTIITHHAGQYPSSVAQATRDLWKKSLVKSTDNGLTVKVLYTFSDQVFREKICEKDTTRMYAVIGLTNNKLMKTKDGGKTFTDITPSTTITGNSVRNISDIAVSDLNPDEIWVTYSGVQSTCKVLYSADGGLTYTNLTQSNLTSSPITKIVFQRGSNGGVYIGNSNGVFYKNKTMANWTLLGNGLPDVDVRFMFINYFRSKLLIGTNRGAWEHDLYETNAPKALFSIDNPIVDCNNPIVTFKDNSTAINSTTGIKYQWSFPGGTPSSSTAENPRVSYKNAPLGNYSATLTVTDKNGSSTFALNNIIKVIKGTNCCQDIVSPWSVKELGKNNVSSTICYTPSNKNYKIVTNATGFSDYNDTVPFVYQQLVGDGEIMAKINSVSNIWNFVGGIMLRNSLTPNSDYAFVGAVDARGVIDLYRVTPGSGSWFELAVTQPFPMWVKITKKGSAINTYYSSDTLSWTLYGSHTLANNASCYVGITASKDACTANISDVIIKGKTAVVSGIEIETLENIQLFPNPAQENIHIAGFTADGEISLLNTNGSLLENKAFETSSNIEFNLNGFAPGVYFLKIDYKNSQQSKVIKFVHE